MRQEAACLIGKHDFTAFCSTSSKVKSKTRTIKKLKIAKKGDLIYIDIEADGFLYNMVRSIVGTLIEIARGINPYQSIRKILESKNRKLSGPTAPAKGLCLMKVKY